MTSMRLVSCKKKLLVPFLFCGILFVAGCIWVAGRPMERQILRRLGLGAGEPVEILSSLAPEPGITVVGYSQAGKYGLAVFEDGVWNTRRLTFLQEGRRTLERTADVFAYPSLTLGHQSYYAFFSGNPALVAIQFTTIQGEISSDQTVPVDPAPSLTLIPIPEGDTAYRYCLLDSFGRELD